MFARFLVVVLDCCCCCCLMEGLHLLNVPCCCGNTRLVSMFLVALNGTSNVCIGDNFLSELH